MIAVGERVVFVGSQRTGVVIRTVDNHVMVRWDDNPHGYRPWYTRRQLAHAPEN